MPFLWLVIMCFTTKLVQQQFEMEETIWNIVALRVVTQHHASMDLLLGMVCFSAWSVFPSARISRCVTSRTHNTLTAVQVSLL